MDDRIHQTLELRIRKTIEIVRARQLQAANLICVLVAFLALRRLSTINRSNVPTRDEILQRKYVREEMLHNLTKGGKCRDLIRMSGQPFMTLCGMLKRDGGLRPTQRMSVEEQVASFMHIVGNDLRNRITSWIYRRSGSTTSRCLHRVLRAIISLEDRYIQQQGNGNRINGNFTSQAYINMIEDLSTQMQMDFTKNHLKNRLKTLKERFSQWYDMFRGTSLSGFSWNSSTQLIEAEDEVWAKLIESKPDAIMLKAKKVSNFHELIELFARDRASGAQSETSKERNARLQKNESISVDDDIPTDDFLAANNISLESPQNVDDDINMEFPTSSQLEQSSSAKKCKSRKRKLAQEDEDLTSMIMNGVGSVAKAISEGNKIIQEGNKILERVYHHEYTGGEIFNELEPMGLESHEMLRAVAHLAANQQKARTLFSCPPQIRLGMLRQLMEKDS